MLLSGVHWLLLVGTSDNRRSVSDKVLVICEMVVHLRVDDVLNNFESIVTFLTQGLDNDFHDLRDHRRESHENSRDNLICDVLELSVSFIHQIKGRSLQISQFRRDQVSENINRWETG